MTELIHDREALLDLAARLRPDIRRSDLEGALLALSTAGWTWPRIVMATASTLCRGEEPRDLRNAATDPLKLKPRSHTR